MGQGIFRCALAFFSAFFCCAAQAIQINEIRIDQPSTDSDEYFELVGEPGESLDGLSYVVIGDGAVGGSGVVEMAISLDGLSIPDDGFFLAAEQTFSLKGAIPDLVTSLNFENSDNLTHLLVSRLDEGILSTDLDHEPDDGTLDEMPWGSVLDAIGLIESPEPLATASEFYYGASLGFIDIGPSAGFVPSHVFRSADQSSSWLMGEFDPARISANDTPGESNMDEPPPTPMCDFDLDGMCHIVDIDLLTGIGDLTTGVESGFPEAFEMNGDNRVDGSDLGEWLSIAAAENGLSSSYLFGDANLDGMVDAQDLNAVGSNWLGTDKVWSGGDFNGDGIVNAKDLNRVGLNWLQSVPTLPVSAAVPEPATLMMLSQLAFLSGLVLRRRIS